MIPVKLTMWKLRACSPYYVATRYDMRNAIVTGDPQRLDNAHQCQDLDEFHDALQPQIGRQHI
eukprot:2714295-Pyramimonas_sp.AAC.1